MIIEIDSYLEVALALYEKLPASIKDIIRNLNNATHKTIGYCLTVGADALKDVKENFGIE